MPAQSRDSASIPIAQNVTMPTEKKSAPATNWQKGLQWALITPMFLGTVPILAKLAYLAGVNVLTVVAFRTIVASLILWIAVYIFQRQYIRTSSPAIISSLVVGAINGIGSIFFYASLTRIDASLGQLVNITYLIFVTLLLRLSGQAVSFITIVRTLLAVFGIYVLTIGGIGTPDWIGVGMMLVGAIMFAIHLVMGQRILYETPAPTMTLYSLTAMAGVVSIAWLIYPTDLTTVSLAGWRPIIVMGLVTGISRLTLFLGVKHMGSMQTALLSILEVVVSIGLAIAFLGETLTLTQLAGAAILLGSILLVRFERGVPRFVDWWRFFWRIRITK
ncbi:MAG: DMT family transporter [Chloroflexota bacterium]